MRPGETIALTRAERERVVRIDELMATGEAGLGPIIEMLTDPSWAVRRAVVAGLAALGDLAVPSLCQLLRLGRDHEARVAATVDALVASTGRVDEEVVSLVDDPNPWVVADAAQILGRRRASGAIPVLVRLTRHPNDNVSVAAIEALGRVGSRAAVESLIDIVVGGSFFRTFPAIDVLGRSGDPRVVLPLARLLDHVHFAPEAARALGRTGDKQAVGPLVSLLGRASEAIVRVGALALSDLAKRHRERYGDLAEVDEAIRSAVDDGPAVRRLIQSAAAADPAEQIAICRVLAAIGDADAVPLLIRLLALAEPVGSAAADALRRLGEQSDSEILASLLDGHSEQRLALLPLVTRRSAAEPVEVCLADPDPAVRVAACDAAARIGNPRAVPALFGLLADENARVCQAAVGAIQSLGSTETEPLALAAAQADKPEVRRAGLRILAYFGYASALDAFSKARSDRDPRVRDAAIQGLPYVDDPRALDELLDAARSSSERVRGVALRSLGRTRSDVRVVSVLLRGLTDADAWVRYYAAQSLGRLGVEQAAPALARLLDDPAGQVQVAGIEALSHLRSELAFRSLRTAVTATNPDVQRAALIGLGISRRVEAESILLEATTSPEPATRLVAVSAVADYESFDVLRALERSAEDREDNVRTAAIGFLSGRSGAEATSALVRLLARTADRERIVSALTVYVDGRIDALLFELAQADDEIAPLLVSALIRMRRAQAKAALVSAMSLPNAAARKAVVTVLAALRIPSADEALTEAADDIDPEVRGIASLMLSR